MNSRTYTANDRKPVWANSLTVTASSAYTAGNSVGGKWVFPNVMGINGSGVIEQITVLERSGTPQKPTLDFLIYGADLASTVTDKVTPTIAAGDDAKLLGLFQVPASSYMDFTGFSAATYVFPYPFKLISPNKDLYMVAIARTTPTFTATNVLKAFITIRVD